MSLSSFAAVSVTLLEVQNNTQANGLRREQDLCLKQRGSIQIVGFMTWDDLEAFFFNHLVFVWF